MSVSHATRERGSCSSMASSIGVGDLVAHLVRVAHRDRLRREDERARHDTDSCASRSGIRAGSGRGVATDSSRAMRRVGSVSPHCSRAATDAGARRRGSSSSAPSASTAACRRPAPTGAHARAACRGRPRARAATARCARPPSLAAARRTEISDGEAARERHELARRPRVQAELRAHREVALADARARSQPVVRQDLARDRDVALAVALDEGGQLVERLLLARASRA